MKKIFSFFTALLFAGSMMAQAFDHGLYVPANASVEVATEVGTTATLDATTGDLTINIAGPHTSWADWGNQIKLTTGVTHLDPTKSYEIGFTAVASTDDCPVSHEKAFDADGTMLFDVTTDKYTTTPMDFHQIVSGIGATSGIFVWSFTWAPTQTVTISNFYIRESAVTYSSLADIRNHVGDTITLKEFEVVYAPAADTRYYYIKDKTAASVIYYAAKNYGLVAGNKVAKGMEAKVENYKGLIELIPVSAKEDLSITKGTAPQPENATAAPTAADQSKYVIYKNVKVAADTAFVSSSKNTVYGIMGNDTIMFYNSFKIAATLEASKLYDIVAVNSVYNDPQVLPISVEEHQGVVDECAGEHGLYDPATATINSTYLAPGWVADAGASATIENGVITLHVNNAFVEMWNGQVFVDPGFTFEEGKMYHYEFDVVSAGKFCMTVKVNDSKEAVWFQEEIYDQNIGGGTYHFSTDSVIVRGALSPDKGPLVFGFGWTDGNQDVIIKCIKITEIGDAPQPVEEKMYIKHPWGTGADAEWAWKEMSECKFKNVDAWTYTGAWGGVGFNIADNAEGTNASWYAATDIQFLDADQILVAEPAVGTANCEFYFVPSFVGGIVTPAYVVVPTTEGFENNQDAVKAVKVIENGQVVIIKNGVRYNALGAQL